MLRVLAGSLTIVAVFGAQALAAGAISEDIPVPGGTVALARAVGLETPPDASRYVAEIARLTYGLAEGHKEDPSSTLHRLTTSLDAAERFQTALGALTDTGAVTLAFATEGKDRREQLKAFLDVVDLRLKEFQGRYSVEGSSDKAAVARVEALGRLGVNLDDLARRLNANETVQLTLKTELVPLPLASTIWSETVFHRSIPPARLFAAIFADRRAALLSHGLAALDDETLQFVAERPRLLERLYEDDAPVFASFASNVRVRGGRVVPAGGPAAVRLWEAVVGEPVAKPEQFVHALLSQESGHLAYLYDLVAELDEPRGAFALGLWIADERVRVDRFAALVSAVRSADSDWNVRETPFARPLDDIGVLLLNMTVNPDGSPRSPSARAFWEKAFESTDIPEPSKTLGVVDVQSPVDAAWLAEAILGSDPKLRRPRIHQLAFGLRAFGSVQGDARGDALVAIRALAGFPALMLTIERMRISDPSVYAAAARAADRLTGLDDEGAFFAHEQFQGALALLSRMVVTGGLSSSRAAGLVGSLAAVPLRDGRYGGLVSRWVRSELLSAIAPKNSAEQAVLAALAGSMPAGRVGTERVIWEGERYRLDLPTAEERRLRAIRDHQRGPTLDTALELEQLATTIGSASIDLSGIQATVAALRTLLPKLGVAGSAGAPSRPGTVSEGVKDLPDASESVGRAIKDLSKITKPQDAKRARSVARPLTEVSDAVLGEALGGIVYAIHLGDAEDNTLLSSDLSRRHDFGLGLKVKAARRAAPWVIPKQVVDSGPRHVLGSLLGLDVAFSRLALRRVSAQGAASTPVLLSNDRDTFINSVAILNPYAMRDDERDAIAAAVARGRVRVDRAASGASRGGPTEGAAGASASDGADSLDTLAAQIKLDGWRLRAARWDAAHDPQRVASLFSLNELMVLGSLQNRDVTLNLDGWGMAATPISGCLCTRLPAPNEWRIVSGRPRAGAMSTVVPDLNLHVAVMLATLRLPAPLTRIVIGAAMLEFVDGVQPNDPDDWLTLARGAQAASREQIEDYVAAATASGPLLPESTDVQEHP